MNANAQRLRTLLIEDVEDDALLLLNELKRGGYDPEFIRVDRPENLVQAMQDEWEVVFCDYSMPNMDGSQAFDIVRQLNPDVPFIFVSGTIGEDVAVEAMRIGARDYIMKGNLKRLVPTVRRELTEARIRKEHRLAEQRLHFLANYDTLTHLPNRLLFLERVNQSIRAAVNHKHLFAVIYVDLDRFKTANDSLGYKAGDMLLRETARRLIKCITADDIVARLAADEFAILLTAPKSKDGVVSVLEKVQAELERPFDIRSCKLHINASLGISLYPFDAGNADDLLRNADIATCRVKEEGGKGYRFYKREMAVQMDEQLALERAMREGLRRQEFVLYYQPKVDLRTRQIAGVEAVIRWIHPQHGLVGPDQFISLAEDTGLIAPLGEWVIREACAQAKRWRDEGVRPLRIAVNVSANQFLQYNLAQLVERILQEYDLEPYWLEVEITESCIMQDTDKALDTLQRLQLLGVTVALDDFGTGYSSLGYLKHFKVDCLKIDRTFIQDLPGDEDDRAIISAVIAMAGKLGIEVVAEGVETSEQYDFLDFEGCDYVQGYYLYRPLEAEQLTRLL